MHRKLVLSAATFAALALLSHVPAFAGAVYVPIERFHPDDQTIVWITNPSGLQASFSTYHIPAVVDGTDRAGDSVPIAIAPGKTMMLREVRSKGMLEVYSESELEVSARFIRGGNFLYATVGESVPVIDSDRSARAGESLHIEGLQRGPGGAPRTDFRIVNLGHAPTTCSVRFNALDGQAVGPVFVLAGLPALSNILYTDVLATIQHFNASGARVETSCDQTFFIYGVVRDVATNRALLVPPRPSTDSALRPPGVETQCAVGATCYEYAGVFHSPTPQQPTRGLNFPLATGEYHRIRLRMEVRVGPWGNPTSGLHNVIWLAVRSNFNLVSYVNFRGPNQNSVLFRHGIGQVVGDKARIERPLFASDGETYVIDYLYDTSLHIVELVISTLAGEEVMRILDTPNVDSINITPSDQLRAGFGFEPGLNPNEPPTYGWNYQNLFIEITP